MRLRYDLHTLDRGKRVLRVERVDEVIGVRNGRAVAVPAPQGLVSCVVLDDEAAGRTSPGVLHTYPDDFIRHRVLLRRG